MADGPPHNYRGWIMLAFSALTLAAAIFVMAMAATDSDWNLSDLWRGLFIIGVPSAAMFLIQFTWSTTTLDPVTVAMVLCVPISFALWAYALTYKDDPQIRDPLMNLGSGAMGVFFGWVSSKVQKPAKSRTQ